MKQTKWSGYLTTNSKNVRVASIWEGNNPAKAKTDVHITLGPHNNITLDGRLARQLFLTLKKHYATKDK